MPRTRVVLAALVCITLAAGSHARADSNPAAPPTNDLVEEPLPITPAVSPPRLGGYIQAREAFQGGIGLTATLNRARLSADGSLPSRFSYRALVEYEAAGAAGTPAGVSLRDAYIRWSYSPVAITVGQYKVPFSRQYITSITVIETADRAAVVDALAPKRDIGVMAECAINSLGTVALGVFNGEGQNAISNRDSTVMVAGRITARPVPLLSLGGNFASYGTDSLRYGFDANLDFRGVLFRIEAIAQHYEGDRPTDYGWYGLAAYRLTPWLQLLAEQEDFRRPAVGPTVRNTATTAGFNAEFAPNRVRLLANYVSRKIGVPGVRKGALITQLQVRF